MQLVHGLQHFVRDRLGKILEDVGCIVRVELLGHRGQRLGLHLTHVRGAHGVVRLCQHLGDGIRIQLRPDDVALALRQRFQEQCHVGRVEFADQRIYLADCLAFQRVVQSAEAFLVLVFVGMLGHL